MTIDRSSWWWQRGRAVLVIVVSLLLAGWVSAPLQDTAWSPVREDRPGLDQLHDFSDSVGQGLILGVLGGFRSIMADFIWIQSYTDWEQQDEPETVATIQLASTLNPQEIMFWVEGSRKIAYDMPFWNLHETGPDTPEIVAARDARNHEMAITGLNLLDRGLSFNPGNLDLLIAKAQIYYRLSTNFDGKDDNPQKRSDADKSAEQYLIAAQVPGSPYYVARIYANTLYNIGQVTEAYEYMRKIYPTLPADNPAAAKDAVWEELRDWEDELKLPADQRLPDSAAPPPEKASGATSLPASASKI